ncbi:MAG: glutamyl-tRNA reductase [Gammaproteobacteria bacterium]
MPIYVFGMNHQTAPLAVRERVAFTPEQLPSALQSLTTEAGMSEALILSTCNRTEVYAVGAPHSERQLADWLVRHHALDGAALGDHTYAYVDTEAVRHALRVACGLDSMVLGEPQILGQIKSAYHTAVSHRTTGKQLNKLMQYTFAIAKQVRTETAIGATPVSVAYAAVRLARQVHGDLRERCALLVGAGDTIELVAQHLKRQGIGSLVIANRTVARAAALAQTLGGGEAIGLDALPARLAGADIVVTSTASRTPLVTRAMLEHAVKARRFEPMFVVDLSVPRNVEVAAETLEDVYLYTIDDLNRVITDNLELRQAAARQAEEIIEARANGFMDWVQSLDGNALIVAYRRQVDAIAASELEKAERRLANGEDTRVVMSGLCRALANKLVHHPLTKIREAATEGRGEIIEVARELLSIQDDALS